MSDFNNLLKMIKQSSIDVLESLKITNVYYGKVVSVSPLRISIEQKLTLGEMQLVLTRNVTDYEVCMTVNHSTESSSGGSGDSSFASHSHGVVGLKTFTVHNGLKVGEVVMLVNEKGGQKFVVVDRVIV